MCLALVERTGGKPKTESEPVSVPLLAIEAHVSFYSLHIIIYYIHIIYSHYNIISSFDSSL